MPAASPVETLDPDVGRRVLQCGCGETRLHTNTREAFAEGWGSRWRKERRVWFCPGCYNPSRLGANEGPQLPLSFWPWVAGEKMPSSKRHSSKSNEHYTPPEITDAVREVFGGEIDLDPASSADANRLVRAKAFYTREDNGLTLPWQGNVWLNPPGGEIEIPGVSPRPFSQAAYWWAQLALRHECHANIPQAAFLIFNLELLRHAQGWNVPQPLEYDFCIFSDRIRYYKPTHEGPVRSTSPTHPSALVYLGPNGDRFRRHLGPQASGPSGFIRSK